MEFYERVLALVCMLRISARCVAQDLPRGLLMIFLVFETFSKRIDEIVRVAYSNRIWNNV